VIKVSCTGSCASVAARGRLAVKRKRSGRRKAFKLKPAKSRVRNGKATLRLKIRWKARRAAARALRRGGRARATVIVTARSATGAKLGTRKKRIALRLRSR
jgi:hypothetical protein